MSVPIGVLLAGGAGRRLGAAKATAVLAGRPLMEYPLAALRATVPDVAIVAKRDVVLPRDVTAPVWTEPDEPRHPLVGVVHALERAGGRPVLACAVDLPFVDAATLAGIVAADPWSAAPAVITRGEAGLQPLLGLYRPAATERLREAAQRGASVRAAVSELEPVVLEVGDPAVLFNVNTPSDLCEAERRLSRT